MTTVSRPVLTTGLAIAGAAAIAVAPVTVPPPHLPTIAVAALPAAPTVHADVALTGLLEDLLAAGPIAVNETVKLFTETFPATFTSLVSTGRFAHLAVLAANAAYLTPLTVIAPFIVAVRDNLPLPLGTPDGVIDDAFQVFVSVPVVTAVTIIDLFASVIDDGLAPFDAVVGTINALSEAVAHITEGLQFIVDTFAGALPVVALKAPQDMARSQDLDAGPAEVRSASLDGPADTFTLALDPPADTESHSGTTVVDEGDQRELTEDRVDEGSVDEESMNQELVDEQAGDEDPAAEGSADTEEPTAGDDEGAEEDPATVTESPSEATAEPQAGENTGAETTDQPKL